jgi:hypothetical protein
MGGLRERPSAKEGSMKRRAMILSAGTITGVLILTVGLAQGQGVGPATSTPDSGPRLRLERSLPPEQQGSRDRELYPNDARGTLDPVLLQPFTTSIRTSPISGIRIGLSGWTTPGLPTRTLQGELPPYASGDLAGGVTIFWNVAMSPAAPTPPPPSSDR